MTREDDFDSIAEALDEVYAGKDVDSIIGATMYVLARVCVTQGYYTNEQFHELALLLLKKCTTEITENGNG